MPSKKNLAKKQRQEARLKAVIKDRNAPKVEVRKYPIFFFDKTHKDYHIDHLSYDEIKELLHRIYLFGTQTWEQIRQTGKHQLTGSEKLPSSALRIQLDEDVLEHDLIVLRFGSANKAMVGYYTNGTYYVIGLDHNFTLYDHGG